MISKGVVRSVKAPIPGCLPYVCFDYGRRDMRVREAAADFRITMVSCQGEILQSKPTRLWRSVAMRWKVGAQRRT